MAVSIKHNNTLASATNDPDADISKNAWVENHTITGELPITNGGTGASSAAAARTALGLSIGTDVRSQCTFAVGSAKLSVTDSAGVVTYDASPTAILATAGLTATRAVETSANGALVASTVTATELGRLSGVTSGVQSQLDSKQPTVGSTTNLSVGNITIAGIANSSLVAVDATGKASAVTVGSGVSYNTTTKTLSGSPSAAAGNNTEVMVNAGGSFAGNPQFTFSAGNLTLGPAPSLTPPGLRVVSASSSAHFVLEGTVAAFFLCSTGATSGERTYQLAAVNGYLSLFTTSDDGGTVVSTTKVRHSTGDWIFQGQLVYRGGASASAELGAGQITQHLDEAGNQIIFTAKYADGITVKTGAVALS